MTAEQPATTAQSTRPPGAAAFRWLLIVGAAGLVAMGVFFRVWKLDHIAGLNSDEAWYGIKAREVLHGESNGWLTPTNNPINPLYFLPVLALHAAFDPSIALLRTAAVLSGLAALGANFWFCRRLLGMRLAVITTTALAVLPICITNSRFGWDPSQIVLVDVFVVYPIIAALQGRNPRKSMLWAAVALGASLIVHPSNIFIAPLLAVAALRLWGRQVVGVLDPRGKWTHWLPCYLAATAAVALVCWKGEQWVSRAVAQATRPGDAPAFALHVSRVYSGVTTFRFLAGSGFGNDVSEQDAGLPGGDDAVVGLEFMSVDGIALWIAPVTLICLIVPLARGHIRWEATFFVGYLLGLVAFFLVGGTAITDPGYERYSLWLVLPGVVLGCRAWEVGVCEGRPKMLPAAAGIAGLALGGTLLWSIHTNYFRFIEQSGGEGHRAFRTGVIDPKQAALNQILAASPAGAEIYVAASETWIYRPVNYLAQADDRVQVIELPKTDMGPAIDALLQQNNVWFVEFTDSVQHLAIREFLRSRGKRWRESLLLDAANRPVITLLHVTEGG